METILYVVVRYTKNEFTGHIDRNVIKVTTHELSAKIEFYDAVTSDMLLASHKDERIIEDRRRNTANGYIGVCVLKLNVNLENEISNIKL